MRFASKNKNSSRNLCSMNSRTKKEWGLVLGGVSGMGESFSPVVLYAFEGGAEQRAGLVVECYITPQAKGASSSMRRKVALTGTPPVKAMIGFALFMAESGCYAQTR